MSEHVARIKAEALREAAESFGENQTVREGDVKEWLRLKADQLVGVEAQ